MQVGRQHQQLVVAVVVIAFGDDLGVHRVRGIVSGGDEGGVRGGEKLDQWSVSDFDGRFVGGYQVR